jgi:quercetin dioxygenase-like cupin family protein
MKNKKNILTIAVAIIGLTQLIFPRLALSQSGVNRYDLQKHDLSIPGREVVQVRVEFDSGAVFSKHNHPGEEIVYVIEGVFEYLLEGQEAVILKAGDVLFIPYGTPHLVKNIGSGIAKELATYIVEKGKPLLEIIK